MRNTYVSENEVLNFVEDNKIVRGIGIVRQFRGHYNAIRNGWKKGKSHEWLNAQLDKYDVMSDAYGN